MSERNYVGRFIIFFCLIEREVPSETVLDGGKNLKNFLKERPLEQ